MEEQLKQELLAFFTNIEHTMKAYMFSLTNKQYIDPSNHMRNIEKINMLNRNLKDKINKL